MHDINHLGVRRIFGILDGKIFFTETVIWAAIIALILSVIAILLARDLKKIPNGKQVIAEMIVEKVYGMTGEIMGEKYGKKYAPYMGTLFFFLVFCNMGGLFGIRPVTADVNVTFACAAITFFLILGSSIKTKGIRGHFKSMCDPFPFMLPLKIIEQVSLPVSLAFRIFGNIFGGAIIMALLMTLLEAMSEAIHLPWPFLQAVIPLPANLFFDVFEPILQAFIFTMLTMVFTAESLPIHDGDNH